MKNMRIFYLLFMILPSLLGCDRLDGLDEGDHNTFTWRGTLYKGYSDEVQPNMPVQLRYERSGITGGSQGVEEELGETVTDENGYFTITYRRLNRSGGKVLLYAGNQGIGKLIYRGDVNQSYFTDFATIRHARIDFKVEDLEVDSLLITPSVMFEGENRVNSDMNPRENGSFVLITQDKEDQWIELICGAAAYTQEEEIVWTSHYYLGGDDFRRAVAALESDTVEYEYKSLWYALRGFPKRDTIILDLSE